jgi:hypothetical protein
MTIIAIAAIVGVALGIASIIAIALRSATDGATGSSSWEIGHLLVSPRLPDRPRGVQEEDLPPFVFHSEAPLLRP